MKWCSVWVEDPPRSLPPTSFHFLLQPRPGLLFHCLFLLQLSSHPSQSNHTSPMYLVNSEPSGCDPWCLKQCNLVWCSSVHMHHAQSCPTVCDPMGSSPPGSSVHGIFKVGILEWVAISSSSRGPSQPRDRTCIFSVSCIGRQTLHHCATSEAHINASLLFFQTRSYSSSSGSQYTTPAWSPGLRYIYSFQHLLPLMFPWLKYWAYYSLYFHTPLGYYIPPKPYLIL